MKLISLISCIDDYVKIYKTSIQYGKELLFSGKIENSPFHILELDVLNISYSALHCCFLILVC